MRINRELGGNFKLDTFEHHAFYNRERHRIEMHLASLKRQKVKVAGETIEFRAGETIHTENSYKYSIESLGALARGAGWQPAGAWTDERNYFSIQAFTLADVTLPPRPAERLISRGLTFPSFRTRLKARVPGTDALDAAWSMRSRTLPEPAGLR